MNGLDILILLVFLGSALIGAMRGFTKELLSLFSWGGSIALAYIFLPLGRGFVVPYIANPMIADGAALFVIFIISLIFLNIIASIIAGYIHESSFRGLDHSLGFGFGMLRGVVFISIAELSFSTFSPRQYQSSTFQHARFIPMVRKGGDTLLNLLPYSLRNMILEQAIKVEHQVKSKLHDHLKSGAPNVIPDMVNGSMGTSFTENFSGPHQGNTSNGQGPQPYDGRPQPVTYPPMGQPASGEQMGQSMGQGHSQGMQPQMVQPQVMQQQGQSQSGMVVIRPPQPAQTYQGPQSPNPDGSMPMMNPSQPQNFQNGGPQAPAPMPSQYSGGLVQSAQPQDTQKTVEQLASLKPQSQSAPQDDAGYTRGQRDDMNRLFQAADGG